MRAHVQVLEVHGAVPWLTLHLQDGSVEAVEVAGEATDVAYPGSPNLALLFEELALE